MSDLCMYELEDIVWDEFDQTDDHIVPHPGNDHVNEPAFHGDSCKKPRSEVIDISSKAGDCYTAQYVGLGKGERGNNSLKHTRDTMLEKDSRSHTPEGVFPVSRDSDSNKEVTSLASESTRMSSDCFKSSNVDTPGTEFCAGDPIIGERCAVVDNDSYDYPLDDISQTDNNLSFFDNDRENKESNDLLYYGWPEIGNFEDVDTMFRSCDSTFGLGGVGNDELGWFSSSHTIEGSEDVSKSDFKLSFPDSTQFKNIPQQHEHSKINFANSSVYDSNIESASISHKSSFQASEGGEPDAHGYLSFMNGSIAISEDKDVFAPKEQVNFQKKQAKHHNSEGKRKDRCLESGDLLRDTPFPYGVSSHHQAFTTHNVQKQKRNIRPDSYGYLQTHIPYTHLNYIHRSDQFPVSSTPSGIKSESTGLTSLSPKDSSYASNQVQFMDCSHDRSLEAPTIILEGKREKIVCQKGFHPSNMCNLKHGEFMVQAASCDLSVPKQVHHSQNEVANCGEVEGVGIRVPTDLDSSNVVESSSVSSGFDEISLEASSFCQLQLVMEQLDIRTKLRIRDSLYRLARNAEQRHHYAILNGGRIDDRDTSNAFVAEGTNKCIMDMETDTNPIDRSIAHLLFHRPSDSSVMPVHDGLSLNSHAMIHGSIASPPVLEEKLVCQEETVSEADRKAVDPC